MTDITPTPLRTDKWPVQRRLSANVSAGHEATGHYAVAVNDATGAVTELVVLSRREACALSAFVDSCEGERARREA